MSDQHSKGSTGGQPPVIQEIAGAGGGLVVGLAVDGHTVRLNCQAGPVVGGQGTAAHWARCSCGWTHRGSYRTRSLAQAEAETHLQQVAA